MPAEMDREGIDRVKADFVQAAKFAQTAGFDLLQLNMAHGYLLASFLSPLTNQRSDEYGGELERRMAYPLKVFDAVRATWPEEKPIAVTISVTDCLKGGFPIEDAVIVARALKAHGCDIIEAQARPKTAQRQTTLRTGFPSAVTDQPHQ